MTKNVALYARLSVTKEESVSIARQLKSGRALAKARGWTVVAEFVDDGVSATANKPEERAGWKALLESEAAYDAVIVWKVDRLARRVLDFLHADQSLQERGAGLVAVEDPIDMTTPQGRAFATMLAVFAEMEAAATSARIKAARAHLVQEGRVVGGAAPFGWLNVPNPSGAGKVLAKDPETSHWVEGMAARALRGETLYSIKQWLNAEGAPLPPSSQKNRKREGWSYNSVERLLRNPILAGMRPHNPGRGRHERSDALSPTAVVRDESGLPVVDESIAVLSTEDWRELLDKIDKRESPQKRPRASKGSTSPLLSRVAKCGHCEDRTMRRGTHGGRPVLNCVGCMQIISRAQLDPYIGERLLADRGDEPILEAVKVGSGDRSVELSDIEEAIRVTTAAMAEDGADVPALVTKLGNLKDARLRARSSTTVEEEWSFSGQTVREAWDAAEGDDEERRRILLTQLESMTLRRGNGGRYLDKRRVDIVWQPSTETHFPSLTVSRA